LVYKPETGKTKPNPNRKNRKKNQTKPEKQSQTGMNRFGPKKPKRTETGRFEPVSVF
jgi:hypothetical protein